MRTSPKHTESNEASNAIEALTQPPAIENVGNDNQRNEQDNNSTASNRNSKKNAAASKKHNKNAQKKKSSAKKRKRKKKKKKISDDEQNDMFVTLFVITEVVVFFAFFLFWILGMNPVGEWLAAHNVSSAMSTFIFVGVYFSFFAASWGNFLLCGKIIDLVVYIITGEKPVVPPEETEWDENDPDRYF